MDNLLFENYYEINETKNKIYPVGDFLMFEDKKENKKYWFYFYYYDSNKINKMLFTFESSSSL